jgi:hypothetical protein
MIEGPGMHLEKQIETLLGDHQLYHSDLQMDCFITRQNGITPYGCYKQALRELASRWNALKRLYLNRREKELDTEETQLELNRMQATPETDRIELERMQINHIRARMELDGMVRSWRDTVREFRRFLSQATGLRKSLLDAGWDVSNPTHRAELEREFSANNLLRRAAVEMWGTGRITGNTLEAAFNHPDSETIRNLFGNPKALQEGAAERRHYQLVADRYEPREAFPLPLNGEAPEPKQIEAAIRAETDRKLLGC